MVGMIIPGWVGESPCILNIAEFSREVVEGVYGSSTMVDRKASRISFLEFSISGDVEKRSVRFVGVHAVEGSNEATDSVTEAVLKRPVRIKLKSKVGLEVTLVGIVGVHVETGVAGERLRAKRLRVSILGGRGGDRVGIALKDCSRMRSRLSRSFRFETLWG